MRERRLPNSPWDYKLEVVSSLEHPEDAHINLDVFNFTHMANELADTIKDKPLINKIVCLPDSLNLASEISSSNRIRPPKCFNLEEDLLEDLKISTYDKVLIVANQNRDGEVMRLADDIKEMFNPEEVLTGVLFEHPDIARKADFAVYETPYRINFPVEALDYDRIKLLLESAVDIAYLLLPDANEQSLDWNSAIDEINTRLDVNMDFPLDDFQFASIMLVLLRDRYEELFNHLLPDILAKKLLPGITDKVFVENK
jgi:hypothetical protein